MNTKKITENVDRGKEFNMLQLLQKCWIRRKLFYKTCSIAVVIGVVVAFSIPKSYETTVSLTPEYSSSSNALGGLGSLASMAGINLNMQSGSDAVYPEIYPEVVSSLPYMYDLLQINVHTQDGKIDTTLYEYLRKYQKRTWWSYITTFPNKIMKWIFYKPIVFTGENSGESGRKIFYSEQEYAMIVKLQNSVNVSKDDVLGMINISVTMQDGLVSQTVADSLVSFLQSYITRYRTNKSRKDLEYAQKIYDEAKENYLTAQKAYANYTDKNMGLVMQQFKAEQERLQLEMNLTYNIYSQMAQQLELAKAKVQEHTPAFTMIHPPVVPIKAVSPRKFFILFAFLILAVFGTVLWIIFKDALSDTFATKKNNTADDLEHVTES